ncbi:DEAD/DEAH box helicase [Nosocomiicoccus ampullae]|uniref:DEAD/DEAH box helicase n=1 Tax=Nosocomiicoccus ampullae TaxID=489910 RepID=UPI00254B9A07|nr:type ISP restriction/modification enzyme [Nosocomiicoccus ampullae]MDK6862960.1 DEAD/DEAH box helicase family protein [Nosocomiicoccus ampullae]
MEENSKQSFDELLYQIDEVTEDVQRERGNLFEKLVKTYLKNEPTYQNLYKNVWLLNEVPEYYEIPKKDTGVDLVAEQYNGDLIAIQAKYYRNKIGKPQIDSFVSETGKKYYQGGLIVSTIDEWTDNAQYTINNNTKGIEVIGLSDLRNSEINWSTYDYKRPERLEVKDKKTLRFYQKTALENAIKHFKDNDRGQLIMAPGTGKTFTSLKIAEALSVQKEGQYKVLYLVPSIQLLTQTLRGWNNDTTISQMVSMAVTSDRDASRGTDGTEDIKASDIGFPATTSKNQLLKNWNKVKQHQSDSDMLVVFSTYQSIDVIGSAQKEGFPEFDLIISDEAHRTTGAQELNKDPSMFTKVHDNNYIKGEKRLYQTATPKIYGEGAKKTAKDKSILLSSMDDKEKFGEVIYRMGFGQAVSHGILTDYKVMVLAVDETAIQKDMQRTLSDPENGLNIDDVGRIVGIWNGMMRRNGYKNPVKNSPYDGAPLERAIAFTRTIQDSKKVTQQFEEVVNEYVGKELQEESVSLSMKHADGTMNALQKGEVLDWLADENKPKDEARIVSNVRFLTEGIDVPALDAVIFLAPKRSQVDIVQAVGRIMRKSEGKDYGYIILPIVIPSGEKPETILDNNKNYEVVWQIINALRSVDERFEAMIDKINMAKPKQIKVIGVGSAPNIENNLKNSNNKTNSQISQSQLEFKWDEFESAIFGKIVQKVGNRKYLENWSEDVAKIAQRQISWINTKLKDKNDPISIEFKEFVNSLKYNINGSIDERQAVEMLSQHLITKPIFEALFEEYSFVKNNPVSSAMENIVRELEKAGFAKEQENLEPLYESVKMRAEGIDKPEDKQKIIITLYDKFFSTAFKSTTERLGIVFTPIEVVDFIIKSVDDVLKKYFDKSLACEGVHVLDPFTGTGTFITRLIQNGLIPKDDLLRKYTQEIHANEIVLLSYYIAAINIEETFHGLFGGEYVPFEGVVLTDTFESTEKENTFDDLLFDENNKRLRKQQKEDIYAIVGNPPYSAKQNSTNDDNIYAEYPMLDNRIRETYAKYTNAVLKNALYDPYIKAIRWASDRINEKGVIGFVTNGSFIDSQTMNGLRKCLYKEFNYIYVFNLRGDQRTQGEKSRKEGGKIFDSGSRTPIAITILVKDKSNNHEIYYNDIGDYLTRNEKLLKISDASSINGIDWSIIMPDDNNDWINQKDPNYERYLPLNDPKATDNIFNQRLVGVATSRDPWVYGFSKVEVLKNTNILIENYNNEIHRLKKHDNIEKRMSELNKKESYVKWTRGLLNKFSQSKQIKFNSTRMLKSMYRPFTKKWLYYDPDVIEMPSRYHRYNMDDFIAIVVPGNGSKNDFTPFVTTFIPEKHLEFNGQVLMLTYCLKDDKTTLSNKEGPISNISENFLKKINLNAKEAFYYVYGLLHSKIYQERYKTELLKGSPRIPIVKNKEDFVSIGKSLMKLHLNYEEVEMYKDLKIQMTKNPSYKVVKMRHPKKNEKETIIFNEDIKITNIPIEAYNYCVNGKSAIEWIMDQYQIKTDNKTNITDDPNKYSENPKYIFNLLLSVINMSMKTMELIDKLPEYEEI